MAEAGGTTMRRITRPLLDEVFDVVDNIKRSSDDGNSQQEALYTAALRAIYARQQVLEAPDPFLTEAVADYSDDPREAVLLYRLSIAQSSGHPDEPTYTKRICMASRLLELGDLPAVRSELILGRAEA
jgi:hypothetical protein